MEQTHTPAPTQEPTPAPTQASTEESTIEISPAFTPASTSTPVQQSKPSENPKKKKTEFKDGSCLETCAMACLVCPFISCLSLWWIFTCQCKKFNENLK